MHRFHNHPSRLQAERARLEAHIAQLDKAADALGAEIDRLVRIAAHAAQRAANERYAKAPWLTFPSRLRKATRFAREHEAAKQRLQDKATERRAAQIAAVTRKLSRIAIERHAALLRLQQLAGDHIAA